MAGQRTFIRNLLLWAVPGLALLIVEVGCEPPQVHLPPPPSEPEARALATLRTQTIPLARDVVFPKAMGVLLDLGFQVRCASQELGQVNIAKTWTDRSQAGAPDVTVEATLLFLPDGPDRTKVRMLASGQWSAISGGKHAATITGVAESLASEDCRAFLDQLVERLGH
jgi:hypothetical protein